MPGVPLDALAQVKRTLRNLCSRRKKKKQPEPTPSSNVPPTQIATAAPTSPVEAPTTSKRSITEAEDAAKLGEPLHLPSHSAADPTTTTAVSLVPDPPPLILPAPTFTDLPTSERKPHIAAPSQIEEAKEIDLNPARDTKIEEASDANNEKTSRIKPKLETGMSATSGPMGDHMAEVWRDSDVGAKEERPIDLGAKSGGIAEGKEEGEKF